MWPSAAQVLLLNVKPLLTVKLVLAMAIITLSGPMEVAQGLSLLVPLAHILVSSFLSRLGKLDEPLSSVILMIKNKYKTDV